MILSFLNSDNERITFSVVMPMYSAISRFEMGIQIHLFRKYSWQNITEHELLDL